VSGQVVWGPGSSLPRTHLRSSVSLPEPWAWNDMPSSQKAGFRLLLDGTSPPRIQVVCQTQPHAMTATRQRPLRPLSSATDLTDFTDFTHSTLEADVRGAATFPAARLRHASLTNCASSRTLSRTTLQTSNRASHLPSCCLYLRADHWQRNAVAHAQHMGLCPPAWPNIPPIYGRR